MQQKFKINVISLVDQVDRRSKIQKLLHSNTIEWSFVDAISGKNIAAWLHLYDQPRRLKALGYDMRNNEIACFLSHRMAWQNCVRDAMPYLVLEDDVKLAAPLHDIDHVVPVIHEICEYLGDELFIRLGNSHYSSKHVPLHRLGNGLDIVRFENDPLSAFAYLISPAVAQKLLKHSEKFFTPVDDFMWRGWEHGCRLLDMSDDIIFTSDEGNPSNIGDRSKPKIGILQKISREYYRFFDNKNKIVYERDVLKKISNHSK